MKFCSSIASHWHSNLAYLALSKATEGSSRRPRSFTVRRARPKTKLFNWNIISNQWYGTIRELREKIRCVRLAKAARVYQLVDEDSERPAAAFTALIKSEALLWRTATARNDVSYCCRPLLATYKMLVHQPACYFDTYYVRMPLMIEFNRRFP